jgi:signal transduction histidine kinase
LAEAQQIARVGRWTWNIQSGEVVWNELTYEILDVAPDVKPSFQVYLQVVHPDDVEMVTHHIQQAVETGADSYTFEYRAIKRNGDIRHIYALAKVVKSDKGEPRQVIGIVQDITEQKLAEKRLKHALDEALQANRLKTELLARVSHELRTPLNAILGYTDILQENIYGPLSGKQQKTIERIFINGEKLIAHINNLLDQAQTELGTIKLQIDAFRATDLSDNIQSVFGPSAKLKKLTLNTSIDPELPVTLQGDLQRLQDILINVVGNAIKFTEQGTINLQIYRQDPQHWALQVSDTGPGIPKEAQTYIFESFRQVDGSITRRHEGVGLGLSIVKQLVSLMGGDIILKSELGKGSTFTIILPLEPIQENVV